MEENQSCFHVSVALSSAFWRSTQDQERNQEETNQRLSYHFSQCQEEVSVASLALNPSKLRDGSLSSVRWCQVPHGQLQDLRRLMGFQEVHGNIERSTLHQWCRDQALSMLLLQVPRVRDSSHGINWTLHQSLADSVYHLIYLTMVHGICHGSTSEVGTAYMIISGLMMDGRLHHFEADSMSGIPSLSLRQPAHGHLRLASFMDEIMVFRAQVPLLGDTGSPSAFTKSRVLYIEAIAISDSLTLSITSQLDSMNESRILWLVITRIFAAFSLAQHQTWSSRKSSQNSWSSSHPMWSQWSSSRLVWMASTQWQCHQGSHQWHQHQASVSGQQWSTSGDQHLRAQQHQWAQCSLWFTSHDNQVHRESSVRLRSASLWSIMVQIFISFITQRQCSDDQTFRPSRSSQQLMLIVNWGQLSWEIVASNALTGTCQTSRLTCPCVAQVKKFSVRRAAHFSEISDHTVTASLLKIQDQATYDSACLLCFIPFLRWLIFSPVVVRSKFHFVMWQISPRNPHNPCKP